MRREALAWWWLAHPLMLALAASSLGACQGDEGRAPYLLWQEQRDDMSFVPVGTALDLGAVDVAAPESARLALLNAGDEAVEVRGVSVSEPGAFSVTAGSSLPRTLGPGSRLDVEISATPRDACAVAAALMVDSDLAPAPLAVTARGTTPTGDAGRLELLALDAADATALAADTPLDFGARAADDSAVRVLAVTNASACSIAIDAPSLSANGAFTLPIPTGAVELAPGAALSLPIRFNATGEAGERSARLTLTSSVGTRAVALLGRVGAPSISFFVGSGDDLIRPVTGGLNFGAVEVGAHIERVVRVVNEGGAALVVTDISCDLDLFQIAWGQGQGALSLAPGASWDVRVDFEPDAPGSHVGTLTVGAPAGEAHLPLVGSGLAGVLALSVEEPPGGGVFTSLEASAEIDFGAADPGDEVFRRVRIDNAGDGALTITSATATNGFRAFLPAPVALEPGEERDFLVRFRPVATVASYAGALEVRSDRGTRVVALRGALTRVCPVAIPAPAIEDGPCAPSGAVLCLLDGRFAVTAANQTTACEGGVGAVATAGDGSGVFSFGGDGWDLVVNMVDTCAAAGTFGLAAAGPTRDRVELRVVDTQTGAVKTWFNPLGEPFQPLIDASAFDTCP